MGEQLREVLKKAEIKRVAERLTKKELCNIYGFNYNFYMNCVSGRNFPSMKMAEDLANYLNLSTQDVYRKVFASRDSETDFHKKLEITGQDIIDEIDVLKRNRTVNMTPMEINTLVENAVFLEHIEEWEEEFGNYYDSKKEELEEKVKTLKEQINNSNEEEQYDIREELGKIEFELKGIKDEYEEKYKAFIKRFMSELKG